MADDPSQWAAVLQWVLANPEKGALFLVVLAGAWRWIRELRKEVVGEKQQESFTEILLRENKELRAELKDLRRRNGNRNET